MRDLFSSDSGKRRFSSEVLNPSFSKDTAEEGGMKDVLALAFDIKNPTSETISEFSYINSNYDYSTFDVEKLLEILQSSSTHYTIKKSSLE